MIDWTPIEHRILAHMAGRQFGKTLTGRWSDNRPQFKELTPMPPIDRNPINIMDPGDDVSDPICKIMGRDLEQHLYNEDLTNDDGDLNHRVLWARVWQVLGIDEADISFDPYYHQCEMYNCKHPAIRGPNISHYTVNGAIVDVLDRANMAELIGEAMQCMADTQDEDGWVYHSGLVL